MNHAFTSVTLSEWETLEPANCPNLVGRFLDASVGTRHVVDRLNKNKLLGLTELKSGLQIKAYSHVGRIQVGDLNVTILPKIKGDSLLSLVRYAYGFRQLKLISDSKHLVDQGGFEDLLVSQLNAEAQELVARGLRRAYIATSERLSSPRGRIDLTRMALDGGTVMATLPCLHYPRIEDTLLNQILMAGLRLAATITNNRDLRCESRRLSSLLEEQVSPIHLDATVLDRADRQMNRLTTAYFPALSIIRLLVQAQGVVLEGQTTTAAAGFLFDMNAFFQTLVSRFDERGLKGMMQYNPAFNPQRRQSPTPRPDFVVKQHGAICSILDAKYRDLWEKKLPSEMLYQLVVYAISHRQNLQSSILYPTTDGRAKEARIDITDPVFGRFLGQVCLRPFHLPTIVKLLAMVTSQGRRDREAYAKRLAFGG